MAKRSYGQRCSLAYAVDLLGERWTLLIFRELLVQPMRYGELAKHLEGIGTNLLSQRLRELEEAGLVERAGQRRQAPYRLTRPGRELEPAILALIRWGFRYAMSGEDDFHRDHWDLLAMKALFVPERSSRTLVVQFDSEALTAWVRASPDGFEHGFGRHRAPDFIVKGTVDEFRSGRATIDGRDSAALDAFLATFDVPERVG